MKLILRILVGMILLPFIVTYLAGSSVVLGFFYIVAYAFDYHEMKRETVEYWSFSAELFCNFYKDIFKKGIDN